MSDFIGPKQMNLDQKTLLIQSIIDQTKDRYDMENIDYEIIFDADKEIVFLKSKREESLFYLNDRKILGSVNQSSICFKDQLRRNGIRFRYKAVDGAWVPW
jgi:hypothetical protein